MPFEPVDYLTIDGYRYHFRNFKRFSIPVELPQLQAVRIQPPNIDAEVQSFEGGIMSEDLDATGNFYRDARGMEPTGPVGAVTKRALRVGRQIVPTNSSGATAITGFAAVEGWGELQRIVAGAATNGGIYQYDGSTWALADTLPAGTPSKIIQFDRDMIVFNSTNANWHYASGAGTTYTLRQPQFSSGAGCYAACVAYGGFDGLAGASAGTPILYRVVDRDEWWAAAGGGAGVRAMSAASATNETIIARLEERYSRGGMIAAGGSIYACGANIILPYHGSIYQLSGATGDCQRVAEISDNYVVSAAYYRGEVYFGMQLGGRLYKLVGNTLELVREFPILGLPNAADQALKALFVYGDRLWVGAVNDDSSRNVIRLWTYDGEGWSEPHFSQPQGSTIHRINGFAPIGVIPKLVMVGESETTGRHSWEISSATISQTGELELPDVVYGAPALRKSYIHGRLQHSPLLAGQSIRLTHKLNDSTVETTDGTNADVGSVETIIPFPPETVGTRLRPKWYLNAASATGGSTNTITAYSAGVRATPLPPEREVWTADLALTNSVYNDGTTDTRDALEKYERILELKRTGRTFQVVDPFRVSSATTLPHAAMMAKIDAQVPLEWDAGQLASDQGGADIRVPIRISQALGDVVGPLNLSFENDAAGATAITGWTHATASGAASISTAQFRVGQKSLALTFAGAANIGLSQAITGLVGGRYYTVGAYIKRALSAGAFAIEVTSTGLGVRTPILTSATDADFDWYEQTFQLPSANTAVTIRLASTASASGTVWVDDVRFTE